MEGCLNKAKGKGPLNKMLQKKVMDSLEEVRVSSGQDMPTQVPNTHPPLKDHRVIDIGKHPFPANDYLLFPPDSLKNVK